MPSLSGPVITYGQEVWSSSATPAHQVGAAAYGSDGRVYRYAKAGVADLVVGNVLQARAEITAHSGVVCRATNAGASAILITAGAGAGALTANQYAGGYAVVDTTPGLGFMYRIAGHAAILATANGQLDLDGETVQVALGTASRLTLVANPYNGVIQHPAAATGACVGGCVYVILANQYGWVQTGGPGAALCAGTIATGQPATSVGGVGSLTVHTAELNAVATMLAAGAAGKIAPVQWLIY
jgi:hypothetical protein